VAQVAGLLAFVAACLLLELRERAPLPAGG
jgi:hypothetical protein